MKLLACIILLITSVTVSAGGQRPFSYQGALTEAGVPANGNYDFQFELFASAAGGSPIAGTEFVDNLPVTDGVFTADLDFGSVIDDGADLFLEISVRQAGGGGYTILSPRQPFTATPRARVALAVGNDSIDSSNVVDGTLTASDVDTSTLQVRVSPMCQNGSALRGISEQGGIFCTPLGGGGDAWELTGNSGTNQGTNFIGNTDDVALDFRVNNQRAMRYEWGFAGTGSPNLIGGHANNTIPDSREASVIAGGGVAAAPNTISSSYAFIGGGIGNQVNASYGSVLGGRSNVVSGTDGVALGRGAQALHDNTFVFNDGGTFASTADDQFLIEASGGVGIGLNNPSDFVHISAPAGVDAFRIQLGGTTRLRVHDNGGVSVGVNAGPPSAGLLVQGEIRTSTPVTRWLHLRPADWRVHHSVTARVYPHFIRFDSGNGDFHLFMAPVHLPHGAVVTQLYAELSDGQTNGNITLTLRRIEIDTLETIGTVMASVNTNGTVSRTAFTDNSIADEVIDNENYHYYLNFDFSGPTGPAIVFVTRITYTTTTVVD